MPGPVRRLTKRPIEVRTTVTLYAHDYEGLYRAAKREGISQAELIRQALRARIRRVPPTLVPEEGPGE